MPSCPCKVLPERLQDPAHQLHVAALERLKACLAALHRQKGLDPEKEALLEDLLARLRQIHATGARYLPAPDPNSELDAPLTIRQRYQIRRTNEHGPQRPVTSRNQ